MEYYRISNYDPLNTDNNFDTFFDDNLTNHRQLTRSQRKRQRRRHNSSLEDKTNSNLTEKLHLNLREIQPKGKRQEQAFDYYEEGKHLFLRGVPGSGKSFLGIYLGLRDLFDSSLTYKKLMIIRSPVESGKAVGYLPGTLKDKIAVYEAPYYGIFSELFGRNDAYDIMKKKGLVEFSTTTFLRGNTLDNCIIIVDESQNLSWIELSTTLSRIGENVRIIFTGDFRQTDLKWDDEKFGFGKFVDITNKMPSFASVDFQVEDILRSRTVKEFIIETLKWDDERRQKVQPPKFSV